MLACRIRLGMEEKKSGDNERRVGGGFAGSGDIGVDDVDAVRVRVRVRPCEMVVVVVGD